MDYDLEMLISHVEKRSANRVATEVATSSQWEKFLEMFRNFRE